MADSVRSWPALLAGPLLFAVALPAPEGLSEPAWRPAALTVRLVF